MISAVIPVYNGERFIADAIGSLMETPEITEIIAVDDGSSDGSVALIKQRFPNVRLVTQTNQRVSAARNRGWRMATNSLIVFLDQDDMVIPSGISALFRAFSDHPEIDMAYGDYFEVDEEGHNGRLTKQPDVTSAPATQLLSVCCSSTVCCLFRRSGLERVGGFDENMIGCEDWDLYLRLAQDGAKFAYVPEPIYRFRYYGTSTSKNFFLMWKCHRQFEVKHRDASRQAGADLEKTRRDKFLNDNLRHLYGPDEDASTLKRRANRTGHFVTILFKDRYLAGNLVRRAIFRP